MEENYIILLRESLEKKVEILKEIVQLNIEQKDILEDKTSPVDEFDRNVSSKDALVQKITKLDDGFDEVFKKVSEELDSNREKYASEIKLMQDLIREITDLSSKVQAQEKENYTLAKNKFSGVRKQVQRVRQSKDKVNTYYKNMTKANYYDPQFLDQKN
ncbi:MAG: flagellar export chaperone FlgN [Lachnospiraceae bacterium]|nr:flagellar export chaperone FlgN [Lachnospiraceae bacterium]